MVQKPKIYENNIIWYDIARNWLFDTATHNWTRSSWTMIAPYIDKREHYHTHTHGALTLTFVCMANAWAVIMWFSVKKLYSLHDTLAYDRDQNRCIHFQLDKEKHKLNHMCACSCCCYSEHCYYTFAYEIQTSNNKFILYRIECLRIRRKQLRIKRSAKRMNNERDLTKWEAISERLARNHVRRTLKATIQEIDKEKRRTLVIVLD